MALTGLPQHDALFMFCFHPIRFSIHVLEWMLCRFFPSARLMPTSVLVEQVVLDRASVTGKLSLSNVFIFNFYHAEATTTFLSSRCRP